jgi:PAS domain S-box-containing protein
VSRPNPPYQAIPKHVENALLFALEQLEVPLLCLERTGEHFTLPWMSHGAKSLLCRGPSALGLSTTTTAKIATDLAASILLGQKSPPFAPRSSASGFIAMLDLGAGPRVPVKFAATPLDEDTDRYVIELLDVESTSRNIAASREIEERFERIVETLASSVWILRNRRIIYGNPASSELLSVERNHLIGIDFVEFCAPCDVPSFLENLERTEQGESVPPVEYRIVTRDGRQLIVEFSSVALDYDGGLAVLSFGRDVTLRKQIEKSRLQADRLSALGLLTGGMAHALNNPLTYVVLNLDHVLGRFEDLTNDAKGLEDILARLEEAKEGAERMATIVKRMRSFARTDESTTKRLDLRSVLESVVELIGHEVRHRGKLTTHFEDVPQVVANESKLEQVFLGLLLFAAQVLPDDLPSRPSVRINLAADERRFAVLEIVCEGCLLDTNTVEKLFDPFAHYENNPNEGFGLSVCKSLVEQLGGRLTAEPLIGTGLLLRTTIPCVSLFRPKDAQVNSTRASSVPRLRCGRTKILLIDDDPNVGKALNRLLEGEHDVRCLESPQAALQELLADANYDLIFCDLMMPILNGMDLFEVLRYNRPGYERKIVFMTGDAYSPTVAQFLSQVPNQRIEKPFNLSVILRLIHRAVRKFD